MDISISYLKRLWLKFKRRFVQYSIQGVKNPKWLLMFVFSRLQIVRSIGISFSKYSLIEKHGEDYFLLEEFNSVFKELNVDNVVESLKRDSFYLGINLPKDVLQETLEFANRTIYLGNGDPQFCFSLAEKEKEEIKYGKSFAFGYHFNPSLVCPAIKKLENDSKLWEIAAKYLVAKPILVGSMMWWSFVTKEAEVATLNERIKFGQGLFHYDLEDYRCVKFMFYLTGVDLSSGPHVCVKGSHAKKKLKHQLSLVRERADQDVIDYYGIENVATICGEAGLGFAEDPFCFHKGIMPVRRNRLILEVKFALNNYGLNSYGMQ